MHRRPSDGWPQRSLALANSTRSGPESTSPAEGQAGYHHRDSVAPGTQGVVGNEKADEWAKIAAAARHPRVEWLNYSDRTEARPMPLPRPPRTPSGKSRRRSGLRQDGGLRAGPPGRNTECRKATSRTARRQGAPRGPPQGTTSRRRDIAAPDNTCTGQRSARPPSAGGTAAPRKRETTSSRCVRNGRCSRRFRGCHSF